jgi:hypothetical protein
MSTLAFTRAAFLAIGITLFAGASGLATPLPTNIAAIRSLAPQSATEVRWGGDGWGGHDLGYRGWGGRGLRYDGRGWRWGAAATAAIGGGYYRGGYYGGGYPYVATRVTCFMRASTTTRNACPTTATAVATTVGDFEGNASDKIEPA